MYLSATVFRFCLYHKMFLHYILVTDIINIIDYYVGIPIEDLERIEQKIVESAIVFWFKDADCKAENKVVEYLGEY